PISRRASSLRARTSSGSCGAPVVGSSPARQTSPPRTSRWSRSRTRPKNRSSGRSTRWMPAWTSSSGPMFGYVPLDDGRQLSTAATPAVTRSSAETRSRSRWSMTATSPGTRRLTSTLVRRPSRAGPATTRTGRSARSGACASGVRGTAGMARECTPVRRRCGRMRGVPFGVYVHVPFCVTRCGYCDFNTYVGSDAAGRTAYAAAAVAEVGLARRALGADAPAVDTVFFGGGTPTLLAAADLAAILAAIAREFGLAPGAEVTTEANPEDVGAATLAALRDAGFTRVSFGMQSAVAHVLATLDRRHTPERAPAAIADARAAGFEHVSLDLIYGTPGESDADWAVSLAAALGAGPDHVSAYAL